MTVISRDTEDRDVSSADDPLLPWLLSIQKALNDPGSAGKNQTNIVELVSNCIKTFKSDRWYQNDVRFLKIWLLYMDCSPEFERIFVEMEDNKICTDNSLRYELSALFLEAKGRVDEALLMYQWGISRNAEPLGRLKKARDMFLGRMEEVVNASFLKMADDVHLENGETCINPWSISTVRDLLHRIKAQILKYEGYHPSTKVYPGKVALSCLKKSARNKVIDIGGKKYQIKGCAGEGGFAQVFKAYVNSNPDDIVALKIQKPPFPWEFYMYRQLDKRIPDKERLSFGFAHRLHLYSDYSILVSDFLANGTLQDAINYNVVKAISMEEVLCIYYTIEMLLMLETLHGAGIIHGDFKPDNLLIRYARDDLPITKDSFHHRTGPWRDQGLCLVDWGRGIDLSLFPENTKFIGDCRTSGFRCIEMQEKRPWTFEGDFYGLCVVVHMMLHGSYMETVKVLSSDGVYTYQPKSSYKRYWQVDLWKNLFQKLLNIDPKEDRKKMLQNIRESFQDYICSNPHLIQKLKQLLAKQRTSVCSA